VEEMRATDFRSYAPPSKEEEDVPLVEKVDTRRKSPEEGEECIDICGTVIRNSSPLVSLKKAGSPAQPLAPASSAVVQSQETKELSISMLLTREKEAPEIREPKGLGWEWEIDGNERWVAHSLQTISKLHSKLASNPSSRRIQVAGFYYGKRV
jgi:hypothetical protein